MKTKRISLLFSAVAASCLLALGALSLSSCGDDGDPLAEKCNSACEVDPTDACGGGNFKSKCIADCRALAGTAAKEGFKGDACGECVAGLFVYSGKRCKGNELCTFGGTSETCEGTSCSAELEVCFGAQGPTGMDVPECKDLCVEQE